MGRKCAAMGAQLALLLVSVSGCDSRRGQSSSSESELPIRLIDRVESAHFETHPTGPAMTPGSRFENQPSLMWRSVLTMSATYQQEGCSLTSEGFLRCGEAGPFFLEFHVAIEPGTSYEVTLEAETIDASCAILVLDDHRGSQLLSSVMEEPDQETLTKRWHSSSSAHQLDMRLESSAPDEKCDLLLRSLRLVKLSDWQSTRDRHETIFGSETELMVTKTEVLLPTGGTGAVVAPPDENFSVREALVVATPSEVSFRLRVPEGSQLSFSYALARGSKPGARVDFEVSAGVVEGLERRLWSHSMTLSSDTWHWHEASVDLRPVWGEVVDLRLRVGSSSPFIYAAWGAPIIDRPRTEDDPPNIILIAVDTLRSDRLSASTSPRLEQLAQDGVRFDAAISQSNWTIPSFASIFTGQVVPRHRLVHDEGRLDPEVATLAERFRTGGWRTEAIAYKPVLYKSPLNRGFEVFSVRPEVYARADRNLDQAVEWITRNASRRFFLFLHFDDPHTPYTQPMDFVEPKAAQALGSLGLELPFFPRTVLGKIPEQEAETRALIRSLYTGEVAYVDDRIGKFLDELERLGLYEEMVIAFVSDHGETLWDHYDQHGHAGVNMHDELIRVPLVIKPPGTGGFRRGEVERRQVRTFDLMPTLLELAGLPVGGADLQAESLVPLLTSRSDRVGGDRPAFTMSRQAGALRTPRWKFVFPVALGKFTAPTGEILALESEELFDLLSDPEELLDVSGRFPEVVRSMRLQAMNELAATLGGRFLVVVGDGRPNRIRVQVRADPPVFWDELAKVGPLLSSRPSGGNSVFEGDVGGGEIVLFARFSSNPETRMKVDVSSLEPGRELSFAARSPIEVVALEPGSLARLAETLKPGVYIFEAPPKFLGALTEDTERVMDPQKRRALRAHGYLQ